MYALVSSVFFLALVPFQIPYGTMIRSSLDFFSVIDAVGVAFDYALGAVVYVRFCVR